MRIEQILSPILGVELGGLELSRPIDEDTRHFLCKALLEHQLLLIRNQTLSPQDLLALAHLFGETEQYPDEYHLPGYRDVMNMDSNGGIRYNLWHIDGTYNETPSAVIVLNARIIPTGGDTLWSNLYAVYESLSEPLRRYLEGLSAYHDTNTVRERMNRFTHYGKNYTQAATAAVQVVEHPLVRTHPESGRRSLFVSPHSLDRIKDVDPAESNLVLDFLYRQAIRPEFVYRHRWSSGDLIIWDNRCTLHYAMADFTGRRLMYRASTLDRKPHH